MIMLQEHTTWRRTELRRQSMAAMQTKQKKKWNYTVGDGWGKLFTLRERISFTEPSPGRGCSDMTDAGMRGRERLLVQAKHRWDEKRRRSEEELPHFWCRYFCSWLPSNTCINLTWHRCGLWWIDSWQDVAMKTSLTKNLNDCDSRTAGVGWGGVGGESFCFQLQSKCCSEGFHLTCFTVHTSCL